MRKWLKPYFRIDGQFPSLGKSVYSHEGHDRWCIMELASDNTLYKMEDDAIYSLDGSVLCQHAELWENA